MRKIISFGLIGIAVISVVGVGLKPKVLQIENIISPVASAKSTSDLPKGEVKEYQVQAGDTFAEVMVEQGVPYDEAMSVLSAARDVFDFTTVGAGKVLKFVFVNEAFAAMEYPLNSDAVVHVKRQDDAFSATKENVQYQITPTAASGTITDSLFVAAKDAGVEDRVIMEMADAFSWDIDFATDIASGDSFSLVYEKRSLDGKPAPAGKLIAAKFTNAGKTQAVYAYDGKYYDENGKSMERQFLRSPLSLPRITSGYSNYRVNPVTRKVETHYAIDYGAAAGTPIVATAKGTVSYAANKGGLGTTVEIEHEGSFLTQYAHMSKMAKGIKVGSEVEQGDVIGYVGSTGISTGPHLQYAMYKGNAKINPLGEQPAREISIPEGSRSEFEKAISASANLLK